MPSIHPTPPRSTATGRDHGVHCRDCRLARVFGDPAGPGVRCAAGWGGELSLRKLNTARQPGFRPATACPDYQAT